MIHQHVDGIHDGIEIEERLAHAHEDDVGNATVVASGGQFAVGSPDLTNDFRPRQVAAKALLSRGAKAAIQHAAHLRRYAQRAPAVAPFGIGNQDRFNRSPSRGRKPFRGAVVGTPAFVERRSADFRDFRQPSPQRLGDVRHAPEVVHAGVIYPLHHLPGAIRAFAEVGEERLHFRQRHAQQIDATVCCASPLLVVNLTQLRRSPAFWASISLWASTGGRIFRPQKRSSRFPGPPIADCRNRERHWR